MLICFCLTWATVQSRETHITIYVIMLEDSEQNRSASNETLV